MVVKNFDAFAARFEADTHRMAADIFHRLQAEGASAAWARANADAVLDARADQWEEIVTIARRYDPAIAPTSHDIH